MVRKIERVSKKSLWGYRGDESVPFLKLTVSTATNLPKVRDEYLLSAWNITRRAWLLYYASSSGANVHSRASSVVKKSPHMKVICLSFFDSWLTQRYVVLDLNLVQCLKFVYRLLEWIGLRYQLANTPSLLRTIEGPIVNWRLQLSEGDLIQHPFIFANLFCQIR